MMREMMKASSILFLTGSFVLAANTVKKTTSVTTTTTTRTTASTTTTSVATARKTPLFADINTGVMVNNGKALPGIGLALNAKVASSVPTFLGIEATPFFRSDAMGALLPILVTGYVELGGSDKIKPSLGIATGPTFNTNVGAGYSDYALLFRPAVNFLLTESTGLNFQTRFGVIGSQFVFVPQLGTSIAIN